MQNFAETDINRFIEAQEVPYFCGYKLALEEVKNGRKINHWIWYIFPQLRCLGRSIEDALDSESTKQGLHIYVTLCFDK